MEDPARALGVPLRTPTVYKGLLVVFILSLLTLSPKLHAQSPWLSTGSDIYYTAGKVGIGTNNPIYDLDVNGTLGISGTTTLNNDLIINRSNEALTIKGTGAADITDANYIAFRRSDNLRLGYIGDGSPGGSTLQFVGDFGIQLNALGNVIDLKDDTKVEGLLSVTGNSGVYSDFAGYTGVTSNNYLPNGKEPTLIVNEEVSGTLIPATGGQVTYRGGISFGRGGPGIYSINPNPAESDYYGEIRFHTTYWNGSDYNNADRMVIKLNGKVGIGTANPDHELTVKGKIHAEEILVDLNVPGPDYVFEADYDLPTLGEIEAFIKANKHLPEVPSAAQMEEEGITLGEMNMLLLKKIEELTLHTINQQKEITYQKSINEDHQQQVANQEQLIWQLISRIEQLESKTN